MAHCALWFDVELVATMCISYSTMIVQSVLVHIDLHETYMYFHDQSRKGTSDQTSMNHCMCPSIDNVDLLHKSFQNLRTIPKLCSNNNSKHC